LQTILTKQPSDSDETEKSEKPLED